MEHPLNTLKIDYWYKAVLVLSAVLLVLSLTVPFQGVSNSVASILSLGGVSFGLGEWVNHPLQERVGPGFKITGYPRRNTLFGNLLVVVGLGLICYGIYRLHQ
jgi:hypothetical protein